jgi:Gnt-I system low-affinity gluconate transporter
LLGIGFLLGLVIKGKLQAFVALLLTSAVVGIAAGLPLVKVIESMEVGMGDTLGFVAIVVGLGAMFGKMLELSGGAEQLARTLVDRFGEDRAQAALAVAGFLVAIPVFFDVGFIILVPLVYSLGRRTGRSLLFYGIPLLAGLAVTHAFVPPTPGPISAAEILGAELGWVILFGVICGIPCAILAGPVFGRYIAQRIMVQEPEYMREELKVGGPGGGSGDSSDTDEPTPRRELPSFGMVLVLTLVPLLLILLNTVASVTLEEDTAGYNFLTFIGHPFTALLITVLLSFYFLGSLRGYSREDIQEVATAALEPAGLIILITGAGGVFKQVLIDSGVGESLGEALADTGLPIFLLAWLIAFAVRVAQGSATVSIVTAAGLVAPLLGGFDLSDPELGLLVIAVAAGATAVSHVNDSGFWLVNRYFGLSEGDTLKSWTVMETIIGVVGIAMVLILSLFV